LELFNIKVDLTPSCSSSSGSATNPYFSLEQHPLERRRGYLQELSSWPKMRRAITVQQQLHPSGRRRPPLLQLSPSLIISLFLPYHCHPVPSLLLLWIA